MFGCETCKLRDSTRVPGYGPQTPSLIVIGESPGQREVLRGKPFVGPAGQLLRSTLRACGLAPDRVYYTNACQCRTDEPLTAREYLLCRERLMRELEQVKCRKILAVGSVAFAALTGTRLLEAMSGLRGQGQMVGDYYVVPTWNPAAVLRNSTLFRDFARDVLKAVTHSSVYELPEISIKVPQTVDEALLALDELREASILSCDLESTGLDPNKSEIISVGLGALKTDGNCVTVILPNLPKGAVFRDERVRQAFRQMLTGETFSGLWVFHNAKFDLKLLAVCYRQIVRPRLLADTMLLHYALDERPMGTFAGHGLKELARTYYDFVYPITADDLLRVSKHNIDFETWSRYQSLDLFFTLKLYEDLSAECREETGDSVLLDFCGRVLIPTTLALVEIELGGVKIDRKLLKQLKQSVEEQIADERAWIVHFVGRHGGPVNFNPQSDRQVVEFVYRTLGIEPDPAGCVARREVLSRLADRLNDERAMFIRSLLRYRDMSKTVSTFVDGLLEQADAQDRVHSDFIIPGTATGRLSSRHPNLQNIPGLRDNEVRNAFIAEPGNVIIGADYSQLELRVAALLSGDEQMIQIFRAGRDIHAEVAAAMFDKPVDQITSTERSLAKRVDFGIIYGRSGASLVMSEEASQRNWTIEDANKFIESFLNRFPQFKNWVEAIKSQVLRDGFVSTIFGNRRRFPFVQREEQPRVQRQAVNMPVQGTAGLMSTLAMAHLAGYTTQRIKHPRLGYVWQIVYRRVLPEQARILFPVHDSIYVECPKTEVPQTIEIIKREMCENLPFETHGLPFPVDIKVGERWGALVEPQEVNSLSDAGDDSDDTALFETES